MYDTKQKQMTPKFSIIYWRGQAEYPLPLIEEPRGNMQVFDTLIEADAKAAEIELADEDIQCRVISLEGVQL